MDASLLSLENKVENIIYGLVRANAAQLHLPVEGSRHACTFGLYFPSLLSAVSGALQLQLLPLDLRVVFAPIE